jgi:hypothetical protein
LLSNTYATGKRYGDIYGYVTDRLYQKKTLSMTMRENSSDNHHLEGTAKVTNMLAGKNPVYQTYFEDGNQVLLIQPGRCKICGYQWRRVYHTGKEHLW